MISYQTTSTSIQSFSAVPRSLPFFLLIFLLLIYLSFIMQLGFKLQLSWVVPVHIIPTGKLIFSRAFVSNLISLPSIRNGHHRTYRNELCCAHILLVLQVNANVVIKSFAAEWNEQNHSYYSHLWFKFEAIKQTPDREKHCGKCSFIS